jgi:hypothetical protein
MRVPKIANRKSDIIRPSIGSIFQPTGFSFGFLSLGGIPLKIGNHTL